MSDRRMDQAGLILSADNFDLDAGRSKDPIDQQILVGCLTGGAGGDRAQAGNVKTVRYVPKMQEGFFGLLDRFFLQVAFAEYILPQAHGQTNILDDINSPRSIHLTN